MAKPVGARMPCDGPCAASVPGSTPDWKICRPCKGTGYVRPRKITTLFGNNGRRRVVVYRTTSTTWLVLLFVDGRYMAHERMTSSQAARSYAKGWT